MSSTKSYDVIIIGSGPGGYVAAIRAAQLGLTVLIVEKEPRLGGVCTLWGCIPTKALLHTADLLEEARHGAEVGVAAREVRLDMPAALKHKEKIVRQSTNGISYLMKKNRVDIAAGFGRLGRPGQGLVTGADGAETVYAGKNILVATGSTPRTLPGHGHRREDRPAPRPECSSSRRCRSRSWSSARARWASSSRRCTPASAPRSPSSRCCRASSRSRTRRSRASSRRSFKQQGIAIYPDTRVERMTRGEGGVEILARSAGDKTETFARGKVLMAVGRSPLTDKIGLEALGVADREGIPQGRRVHADQRPGVYAIGDVLPTPRARAPGLRRRRSSPSSTWPARRPVRSTTTRCPGARTASPRSDRSA